MAASKSNPAMEFIVESLNSNRSAAYKDIAEAAAKKKLKIYPIMFGRAQALLGIVKAAPRGQGDSGFRRHLRCRRGRRCWAGMMEGHRPRTVTGGRCRPLARARAASSLLRDAVVRRARRGGGGR